MMVQFTNMPYLDEPIIPKESLAFKGQKLSRTTMVRICQLSSKNQETFSCSKTIKNKLTFIYLANVKVAGRFHQFSMASLENLNFNSFIEMNLNLKAKRPYN